MCSNKERYEVLKEWALEQVKIVKTPRYGRVNFVVTILSDRAEELTTRDLLILADQGNLCFGGDCKRINTRKYEGYYYTD